jgi:hypothetical protein
MRINCNFQFTGRVIRTKRERVSPFYPSRKSHLSIAEIDTEGTPEGYKKT